MKSVLKIIFIAVVILGLVASYTFLGDSPLVSEQQAPSTGSGQVPSVNSGQANTENSVKGPTAPPSTNGPDGLPPAN